MQISDTEAYKKGYEWASKNAHKFVELFTSKELATGELRGRLFKEAMREWPSQHDSLENDLKQTAFVAGAFKAFANKMPLSTGSLAAIFDTALEMSSIWSAEVWKSRHLEALKEKPASWWKKKHGIASPIEVAGVMSVKWRKDYGPEKGRKDPKSKWEVLIDTMGTRELSALATLEKVEDLTENYPFPVWRVEGEDSDFEVVAAPAYTPEGRIYQWPGEIIG